MQRFDVKKEYHQKSKFNTGRVDSRKSRGNPQRFMNKKLWEVIKKHPNETESNILYIDEDLPPKLLGRLEMGLGLIMKELKESSPEIRDFMLEKGKDKVAKDTIRNLLKEMLDGKEVGTGIELKQQFKAEYTNEKLFELINHAATNTVDLSVEEELARKFYKSHTEIIEEQIGYFVQKLKDTITPEVNAEKERLKTEIETHKDELFIGDAHSLGLLRQNIKMGIIEYLAKNKAMLTNNIIEDNWVTKYQVKHLAETLKHYPKEAQDENYNLVALVAKEFPAKEKIKEFLAQYKVSSVKKDKKTNFIYVKLANTVDYEKILAQDGCEIEGVKISIKPAKINKKDQVEDKKIEGFSEEIESKIDDLLQAVNEAENGGANTMDIAEGT